MSQKSARRQRREAGYNGKQARLNSRIRVEIWNVLREQQEAKMAEWLKENKAHVPGYVTAT
jgi:hypothetical protein